MTVLRSFLLSMTLLCQVVASWAQSYPSQPLKLIYPFAPGTRSESVLRVVAERLSDSLKQPVVIENRPGAGSTLGTDIGSKAAPDGYTLIATFNSSIAPGPLMYQKLGYDPVKDFKHLALIGVFPQFMIVRADHPAKNLQEFIAMVRAKSGSVNYSSAGVGTAGFLAGELKKKKSGLGHGPCALQRARAGHQRHVGRSSGYGDHGQCRAIGRSRQGQDFGRDQ